MKITPLLAELCLLLKHEPLLTRSHLAVRWGVSLRRIDMIRNEDPKFPRPRYVTGPRWTPEEIGAYEKRFARPARVCP